MSDAQATPSSTRDSYAYGAGYRESNTRSREVYLYDGRGSVSEITENGNVTATLRYGAYGELLKGAPAQDRTFGFNGEQYTPQNGLQYLRARHYDPNAGVFTTQDSYLGNLRNPLSQNRYAYCENDPVGNVDPSGHRASSAQSYNQTAIKQPVYNYFPSFNPAWLKPVQTPKPSGGGGYRPGSGGGSATESFDWAAYYAELERVRISNLTSRYTNPPQIKPTPAKAGFWSTLWSGTKKFFSDAADTVSNAAKSVGVWYEKNKRAVNLVLIGVAVVAVAVIAAPVVASLAGSVAVAAASSSGVLAASTLAAGVTAGTAASVGAGVATFGRAIIGGAGAYVAATGAFDYAENQTGKNLMKDDMGESTYYAAQGVASHLAVAGGSVLVPFAAANLGSMIEAANSSTGLTSQPSVGNAGGAYGTLETNGGQRHHMPANSVNALPTSQGPAIRMEVIDHMQTASYGSGSEAAAYRALQSQLVNDGDFIGAMQMDINNVQSLFGTKYNDGINDMVNYTQQLYMEGKI